MGSIHTKVTVLSTSFSEGCWFMHLQSLDLQPLDLQPLVGMIRG